MSMMPQSSTSPAPAAPLTESIPEFKRRAMHLSQLFSQPGLLNVKTEHELTEAWVHRCKHRADKILMTYGRCLEVIGTTKPSTKPVLDVMKDLRSPVLLLTNIVQMLLDIESGRIATVHDLAYELRMYRVLGNCNEQLREAFYRLDNPPVHEGDPQPRPLSKPPTGHQRAMTNRTVGTPVAMASK